MGRFVREEPTVALDRLTVYEFHGATRPCGEPHDDAFRGLWPEPPFYYLFFAGEAGEGLYHWLSKQRGWVLRDTYHLAYEEWQQVVDGPVRVGPFLIETVTALPACQQTESAREIVLRIDPGLVFGSGLHGSTRGCLSALADLFSQVPVATVVDMGAGTAILAIACGALGASRVLAIDKNLLAIRAAARNVRLNRLHDRVELLVAEHLGVLREPSELLIMNLEPPILQQLLAQGQWLDYPWVVLSGFLERQWCMVKDFISPCYEIIGQRLINDWLAVTITRRRSKASLT